MKNPWYSFKAAAEGSDVAEVFVLDAIGSWYGVSAKEFLTEFRALKAPNVKLYINSPGGSVFEALAIFNGMRATGKNIEVHVLGIAASAASYLAMVGHKVVMPANTMMFLHNPINGVYGNADDMREMADTLDKIGASLTATYSARWKGEQQALLDVLAAETYLTAAECLEHGLCDEVTPEITAEARFDVDSLPDHVQALFRRTQPAPVAPAALDLSAIEAAAAAAGLADHAGALALDESITTPAALEARVTAARDIVALCRMTGRPADAAMHIAAHRSVADVRAALNAALVAASDAAHVDTAAPSKTLSSAPQAQALDTFALWREIKQSRSTK